MATPIASPGSGSRSRTKQSTTTEGSTSRDTKETRDAREVSEAATAPHAKGQPSSRRVCREIPTPWGVYTLGRTIGAGSMGKVKLATHVDGKHQLACKIIPRDRGTDSKSSSEKRSDQPKEYRTQREASIGTLLKHPYICALHDVLTTGHNWYLLFEYVNGGQLLDYIIERGKLKEKQARKFSRQIASAVDYCHRNSIVHRDLKIENILISRNGDIKIIDFGLSNMFAPRGVLKTFCGSLYFAAPELLEAREYTGPEVDVWSFGVVLYVLVCGKVPFDDQNMPALHAKIKLGAVDYPTWLSPDCKDLISRMLIKDPRKRATMSQVMSHPWMIKGYPGPPSNYLPRREPLSLPLDPEVIHDMYGFGFGSSSTITHKMKDVIQSEEYQNGVYKIQQEPKPHLQNDGVPQKKGLLDFYRRRASVRIKSAASLGTGGHSSESTASLPFGKDPLNAYNPMISVYYLVREKQDRERGTPLDPKLRASSSGGSGGGGVGGGGKGKEKPTNLDPPIPEISPPEEAHTRASTDFSGGNSRRAEESKMMDEKMLQPKDPRVEDTVNGRARTPEKKESTTAGILRRFSTRRRKEPDPATRGKRMVRASSVVSMELRPKR